jgi:hypothetical protein
MSHENVSVGYTFLSANNHSGIEIVKHYHVTGIVVASKMVFNGFSTLRLCEKHLNNTVDETRVAEIRKTVRKCCCRSNETRKVSHEASGTFNPDNPFPDIEHKMENQRLRCEVI